MRRLFRQFSFPGGIPSHVSPETPGSIHEGGELGYSLAHAFGAAFDNPDLLVACVVGDGEAETGPLAASWHSNKFLDAGARRRRAAHPAPERLQDREPHGARPHGRRRARTALPGLRLPPLLRGGQRARAHAPAHGRGHGPGGRGDPRHPAGRPRRGTQGPPGLAHDRAAHAQGLDRAQGRRRPAGRGHATAPTRCRSAPCAPTPSTSHSSKSGCAATGPRSCSTRTARSTPSCAAWRPSPTAA